MRQFSRSTAFYKMRLVNGAIFMLFGLILVVRGAIAPGAVATKFPLFVLAGAMFLLGFFRIRAYLQARSEQR